MVRALTIAATLGLALASVPALAQYGGYGQVAVTLDEETQEPSAFYTFPFFQASCLQGLNAQLNTNNEVTLSWTPSVTGGDAIFVTTDSTCNTSPDGGSGTIQKTFGLVQGQEAYVAAINVEQLLSQYLNVQDPCDLTPAPSGSVYICVTQPNLYGGYGGYGYGTTTTSSNNMSWYMTINYDMGPPPAPNGISVTSGDSELQIAWSYPSSSTAIPDHFIVYGQPDSSETTDFRGTCTPRSGATVDAGAPAYDAGWDAGAGDAGASDAGAVDAGTAYGSGGSGGTQVTSVVPDGWPIKVTVPSGASQTALAGLNNNQCYEVSIRAFYADGTEGYASAPLWEAPIEIFDYWRLYDQGAGKGAGGIDPGGLHCQAAAGGLPPLAFVASALLFWRRRRRGQRRS